MAQISRRYPTSAYPIRYGLIVEMTKKKKETG